jgi:hypothetical protein
MAAIPAFELPADLRATIPAFEMPPNLGASIPAFEQPSDLRAEIPAFENAFKFEGVDSTRHFKVRRQSLHARAGEGELSRPLYRCLAYPVFDGELGGGG